MARIEIGFQCLLGEKAALGHQEGLGSEAPGRVMMKAAPLASLVVSQPDLLFEFFLIALNPPAQFGEGDQLLARGPQRQRGEPILGRFAIAGGPFEEQPFFLARCGAPEVLMGGSHTPGGEA
jgi:hypothetical protein